MSLYLQRIQLRNFRTFGHFDLDLAGAPGVVIITGPNGLGKSSFFDAIEWGLTSEVKHFERYLSRGNTEADYLTREGAERFSHAVNLSFSDGHQVEREGNRNGPSGTSDQDLKSLLVSPGWGQQVDSLSTYLALTHFLGQGSQQRFMSREAPEQWNALRVPSGVERLEHIRKRLRGRSATLALKRKAETAALELSRHEDRLAQWDALIERLRRQEGRTEAAGAIPRDQIIRGAEGLNRRLSLVADGAMAHPAVDLEQFLTELRTRIVDANKAIEAAESRLMQLARIPEQHTNLSSRQSAASASLVTLRAAKIESEEALSALEASVEILDRNWRDISKRGQRLRERMATLLGAQTDLDEAAAAARRRITLGEKNSEIEASIAELRLECSKADEELAALQSARSALAVAEERHSAALALVVDSAKLSVLEDRLSDALLQQDRAVGDEPELSESEYAELEVVARSLVESRRLELEERRDRAGAISSALATISAHLGEHDTNCPLCKSHFDVGELKKLAELSAREADEGLPVAQTRLDDAQAKLSFAQSQRAAAVGALAEIDDAAQEVDNAQSALDALRNELFARLELMDSVSDIAAVAAARLGEWEIRLDSARRALASMEIGAVEMQHKRNHCFERLQQLEADVTDVRTEIARAISDLAGAERRFQVRGGEEGLSPENVPALLAKVQADIDEVDAAQEAARRLNAVELQVLSESKAENLRLGGALAEQEQTWAEFEKQITELTGMWSSHGLLPPPAQAVFEHKLAELSSRRFDLSAIESERQRLVAALEFTSGQEELDNLRGMVSAQIGTGSVETTRANMEAAVAAARSHASRIQVAREAIHRLAERLQDEADSFSDQFLRPLNELIGAFNDALLTSPGTSVFFNADYFADRTEFSARIRRRAQDGGSSEIRNLNPQLILSEGQLAANGFSILCSASVSYPWSRWRALLLDDPLQHNDVIHSAAFTDVMRNLVELEGYQVLMSSHDRAETEFVERKFSAAGLPCTVVQLISAAPGGVSYEVRNNAAASEIIQGYRMQHSVEQNDNSADNWRFHN